MSRTILTVDDSLSIRQMVRYTLQQAGFNVVEAQDGKEALTRLEGGPVDLVVTDLNMPVMDGLELIRAVRALPKFKFVPVLMLTTESQEERRQAGKAAGATGWIVKPFNPDQLLGVIARVLR